MVKREERNKKRIKIKQDEEIDKTRYTDINSMK